MTPRLLTLLGPPQVWDVSVWPKQKSKRIGVANYSTLERVGLRWVWKTFSWKINKTCFSRFQDTPLDRDVDKENSHMFKKDLIAYLKTVLRYKSNLTWDHSYKIRFAYYKWTVNIIILPSFPESVVTNKR
jgi:hypothetical protein